MMDMDKHEEVTREETEDDHDDDDVEKATAAGDGKEQAIHSLLAFSNSPSVGVQAVTTAESQSATTSSGSTHRREEQLLTNRISARDRRKRQKVANEYMKNENFELKTKLRQQDVEIKELKSRTENLEYALRQACIDNLTLLIAPTAGIGNSQQQQQQQQQQFNSSFPEQMQQNTQHERQQPRNLSQQSMLLQSVMPLLPPPAAWTRNSGSTTHNNINSSSINVDNNPNLPLLELLCANRLQQLQQQELPQRLPRHDS